jgi:putative tryptophan/tyrosine transport system substrate-binding protein
MSGLVLQRREFITLLGGAAAVWPLAARAQQPAMPAIGLLGSATAREWAPLAAAFLRGLSEAGHDDGRNVAIEYRWADGQYDRLPAMAADLVRRQVTVIAALTSPSAIAAKAATAIIPIVFTTIADPVQIGLVASLNRPGGNLTGVTILNVEIVPKMLELLHEVVPTATTMAALVNPTNPNADTWSTGLQVAARTLGLELNVLRASTERDIDEAFATLIPLRVGGLVIVNDVFLITREEQLAALALRHKLPTIFQSRESVVAGGLMSYGGSASDAYRQAGVYTGRVLKGEKPADLPVQQATKVELYINLKTAKTLGITIPLPLPRRRGDRVKRRQFISLLGAAAAWPLAARAQQSERMRRVGVLMNLAVGDPEGEARVAAFLQALQQLGWSDGRNVRIDYRWAVADVGRFHRYAEELVALAPDAILASGTPSVQALQQVTRTVPIVFAQVIDPVGIGFVASLARPGGNITGFSVFEYGLSGKWLELLKEIAPRVTRVAVLRDLTIGLGQLGAIQSVAPSLGVELTPIGVRDADEIERGIMAFAQGANGGLIATGSTGALFHRGLIVALAARHRLPAVYFGRYFVTDGGLISYGPDFIDLFRRAAGYVDRILKGEKPVDLPVQAPTKYELVINLKTAKALGLEMPATVLARADEVIE